MSDDWTTIRVPDADYAAAKERKDALGVTWGEYVNPDAIEESVTDGVVGEVEVQPLDAPDAADIAHEVVRQFDYAELAGKVASELEEKLR